MRKYFDQHFALLQCVSGSSDDGCSFEALKTRLQAVKKSVRNAKSALISILPYYKGSPSHQMMTTALEAFKTRLGAEEKSMCSMRMLTDEDFALLKGNMKMLLQMLGLFRIKGSVYSHLLADRSWRFFTELEDLVERGGGERIQQEDLTGAVSKKAERACQPRTRMQCQGRSKGIVLGYGSREGISSLLVYRECLLFYWKGWHLVRLRSRVCREYLLVCEA